MASDETSPSGLGLFASAWFDALDAWVQAMRPGGSIAPQILNQQVLPGWSLVSITNENSADPEVERRIVQEASYGRQIGRMMDAVAALVAEAAPDSVPEASSVEAGLAPDRAAAFAEFWALVATVDAAKREARSRQLSPESMQRLARALIRLKKDEPAHYRRLAGILRGALEG
jgi:hypothetical protein